MDAVWEHPFLGLTLSIAAYGAGLWVKRKTGSALANPLLVAAALVIAALHVFSIPLERYRAGGALVTLFIIPATTALALQVDRHWSLLRANALPVVGSCLTGSLVSIASVYGLCRLFGIDETVTASLLPKSVTTAIAVELSVRTGGLPALTVSAVILTGIMSVVASPVLARALSLRDAAANGLAMGVSGHAIGTSRALEAGETEGAFSGVALCLSGVVTSVVYALLF